MNGWLGAVLAGGQSRRFGRDKAFADLGGSALVKRAERALGPAVARVVVIANDVTAHGAVGRDVRADIIPGIGPLGGLHAAVAWASEQGLEGAAVLATDMPFVPASLFAALADRLGTFDAAVPESRGPRGFEPLCGLYRTSCLGEIEAAIRRGDRSVVSFFPDIAVSVLPLSDVERHGDAERMFFNVNRPQDHVHADRLLAELEAGDAAFQGPPGHAEA